MISISLERARKLSVLPRPSILVQYSLIILLHNEIASSKHIRISMDVLLLGRSRY